MKKLAVKTADQQQELHKDVGTSLIIIKEAEQNAEHINSGRKLESNDALSELTKM